MRNASTGCCRPAQCVYGCGWTVSPDSACTSLTPVRWPLEAACGGCGWCGGPAARPRQPRPWGRGDTRFGVAAGPSAAGPITSRAAGRWSAVGWPSTQRLVGRRSGAGGRDGAPGSWQVAAALTAAALAAASHGHAEHEDEEDGGLCQPDDRANRATAPGNRRARPCDHVAPGCSLLATTTLSQWAAARNLPARPCCRPPTARTTRRRTPLGPRRCCRRACGHQRSSTAGGRGR